MSVPTQSGEEPVWNYSAICGVCGYEAATETVNAWALQLYNLGYFHIITQITHPVSRFCQAWYGTNPAELFIR